MERELRAQIDLALALGIDVTHLDVHMFAVFTKPDYVRTYKKLGIEYRIPVLLDRQWVSFQGLDPEGLIEAGDIVFDNLYMVLPDDYASGLNNDYAALLKNLKPGFNVILLHAAMDNEEMRAVCIGKEDFGAKWRQQDFRFFSSKACAKVIKKEGVQLVTWREICDKVIRK